METDKEVLELCKSWFDDIAERSERLTTGNVSHCGRAIHGVAINYAEYVSEHLHNSDRDDIFCGLLTIEQDWDNDDELIYQHCLAILHDYGYDNWIKERIKGNEI